MSRIKGTQLIGVVKALRAHRERATKLAPPHLLPYLEQRLLVSAWYPEADFRDLMLLLGRMLAPSVKGNVWRLLGSLGAQRDFTGIYAGLLRKGDPERTLRILPDGWRQYRDKGQLSLEELGKGAAQLTLREYPLMCSELAEVNAGYFEGTLQVAGAATAQVDVITFDNNSAYWRLSWT